MYSTTIKRYQSIIQVTVILFITILGFYWITHSKNDNIAYSGEIKFYDVSYLYTSYLPKVKNPQNVCNGKRVLVAIKSAPNNTDKRKAIRESWGSKENTPNDYLILFMIGSQNDTDVKIELEKESEKFDDFIRYDLVDSYRNLTLKIHVMYDFYQKVCPQAKYLLQLDDDVAIDLMRFDHFVQKEFDQIVGKQNGDGLFCTITYGNPVLRDPDNKHYVPEKAYAPDVYPNYCIGPTMVLTHKTVDKLLSVVPHKYFVPVDDAFYSGIVQMETDVPLTDPGIFCLNKKQAQEKCKNGPKSVTRIVADCRLEPSQIESTYKNITQMFCP